MKVAELRDIVLCWLLVSASYILKWATVPTEPSYFPLTSDFFAMLAYPAIAAGHFIVLAATFHDC